MEYNEELNNGIHFKEKKSVTVFRFSIHAALRMAERGILKRDVIKVYNNGEVIDEYPEDDPYPSRLILGWLGSRPIHLVVADHPDGKLKIIITVYEPDPNRWEENFKKEKTE
jgi:hypothetical protein